MGNTKSATFEKNTADLWWKNQNSGNSGHSSTKSVSGEHKEDTRRHERRKKANAEKLEEVKKEISTLHEKRLRLIAEKKKEMDNLRQELATLRNENRQLKESLHKTDDEHESSTTEVCENCEQRKANLDSSNPPQNSIILNEEHISIQEKLKQLNEDLKENKDLKERNIELMLNLSQLQKDLERINSQVADFEKEKQEYRSHVLALKDVIKVSKELIMMREGQIKQLRSKIDEIEKSLAELQPQPLADDVRLEYQKQLNKIKQLRIVYEERQRTEKVVKEKLQSELEDANKTIEFEQSKQRELQSRIEELEKDNSDKYDNIISLESSLGLSKAECRDLRTELTVINQLFSQILIGFNNNQVIDLDKLVKLLEENHDLLTDIVGKEESHETSSALPKVLLDLVNQVNNIKNSQNEAACEESTKENDSLIEAGDKLKTIVEESESQSSTQGNSLNSPAEIVQNLPKVWRVLTELLSHQSTPANLLSCDAAPNSEDENPCYKSVQTPSGPRLVLSVSKTFIRLKDLIVEKKCLEKETGRLKQLNGHLETRLQDQEKRLEMVSTELSKTWHIVGKMQKQHQQLHTQEKILRYELAQKRKLLTELKEELEYCREKWLQAREKNNCTEEQWKQLRSEFASRKTTVNDDSQNSVESGFSDDRESDEEPGYETDVSACSPENTPENSQSTPVELDSETKSQIPSNEQQLNTMIDSEDSVAKNEEAKQETILKVIKDEIENIENTDEIIASTSSAGNTSKTHISSEEKALGSTEEVVHSILEQPGKTELVQSDNEEKTEGTSNHKVKVDDIFQNSNGNLPEPSTSKTELPEMLTTPSNSQISSITINKQVIDETYRRLEEDILQVIENIQNPNEFTADEYTLAENLAVTNEITESAELTSDFSLPVINETIIGNYIPDGLDTGCEGAAESKPDILLHDNAIPSEPNAVDDDSANSLKNVTSDVQKIVEDSQPSTSSSSDTPRPSRTAEEILAAREERLRRLEDQCQQLVSTVVKNSIRGYEMCNKLSNLHEQYGEGTSESEQSSVEDSNTEEILPETSPNEQTEQNEENDA